jgi:hypothetical protein
MRLPISKSEIRNSKSETNANIKIPMIETPTRHGEVFSVVWVIAVSGFGFVSDFEFRISCFWWRQHAAPLQSADLAEAAD